MTAFDDKMAQVAVDIIAKFPKVAVITQVGGGTYNPLTRSVDGGVDTTETETISAPIGFKQFYIDGTTIKATDLQTFVANQTLDLTPELDTKVAFDGVTYTVLAIKPLYSGEAIAVYELHLRR